ncbi:hypothetical protein NDI47_09675 [Microcoleus vaginatus GB1-A2]|uniref:hypothetical protein n=1 Tax=Microcoleus vaginatus TaxID=119532 RepID=UPI001687E8A5|nr:hypothetical protein [Microcoleus sp. FACHB-61]
MANTTVRSPFLRMCDRTPQQTKVNRYQRQDFYPRKDVKLPDLGNKFKLRFPPPSITAIVSKRLVSTTPFLTTDKPFAWIAKSRLLLMGNTKNCSQKVSASWMLS